MSEEEIKNTVLQDLIDYCESKMTEDLKTRTQKPQPQEEDLERMKELAE